jgi:type I restriction enzyme S subunit
VNLRSKRFVSQSAPGSYSTLQISHLYQYPEEGMETANAWPLVPLSAVLTRSEEQVEIRPDREYLQVTVRLWGGGVVPRNEVSGTRIAAKKRYVVHPQQFLLSRIDARNGAFGLVPESLDGAVVSNDFPAFNINGKLLEPRFLEWMSKTKRFVDLCRAASEGTTNRVRLQVDRFLVTEIPLPPLEEQRRIVARIEELAARIEAARVLRQRAVEETERLFHAALTKLFTQGVRDGWSRKQLKDIVLVNMGQSPPGDTYNQIGDGLPLLNGPTEFGNRHPTPIQWTSAPTKACTPGDILICVRGNTTGKMNWADQVYCIGRGLAALTPDQSQCLPEYVYNFLQYQTRVILDEARGSTFPNLPGRNLQAFEVPIPSIEKQRRIVAYLDDLQARVEVVQQHQAATGAAIDAFLPSILDRAFGGEL